MSLSHRVFQIVQAALVLVLILGGLYIATLELAYGLVVIFLGLALFLYDRRGFFMTLLANQAYKSRGLEAALEWLRKAWKSRALDPQTQITFAYLLMKAEHWEEAQRCFSEMQSGGPWFVGEKNMPLLRTYRAMLWWKQGQRQKAADELWSLLESSYKTLALLTSLGVYLLELHDWERFEKLRPIALDYDAEDLGLLDNEGAYLIERGRLDQAQKLFEEKIIPRNPSFADAWIHWARLCRRRGLREEARAAYLRALDCPFHGLSTFEKKLIEREYQEVAS